MLSLLTQIEICNTFLLYDEFVDRRDLHGPWTKNTINTHHKALKDIIKEFREIRLDRPLKIE